MVIDMLNHAVKAFDTHDLDDIVYVDDKEADLDYFNKKLNSVISNELVVKLKIQH